MNESLVTHLNESCSQSTETRAKNVTPESLVSVDSSLLYQQIGTHHVSRFTLLRVCSYEEESDCYHLTLDDLRFNVQVQAKTTVSYFYVCNLHNTLYFFIFDFIFSYV